MSEFHADILCIAVFYFLMMIPVRMTLSLRHEDEELLVGTIFWPLLLPIILFRGISVFKKVWINK